MSQQDIDVAVESYRVRLGLRPWQEFADEMQRFTARIAKAYGIRNRPGRRSGRTAFGILKAIARCEEVGAMVLAVNAKPTSNMSNCLYMARNFITRLGINIRVTPDFLDCSRGDMSVVYTDHHLHVESSSQVRL